MDVASLCMILTTLNVRPDSSQIFVYDSISLSCEGWSNSSGWTVRRNTTARTAMPCESGWGIPGESSCSIEDTFTSDSGLYWCEARGGGCSSPINITVTDSVVILESPVHPVSEGEKVTLVCSYKGEDDDQATSAFTAEFYKDGYFIGNRSAGRMTVPAVSTADEGLYKCKHPTKGESPESWLAVRGGIPLPARENLDPAPVMSVTRVVCGVLLVIEYMIITILVCICIHQQRARARAEKNKGNTDDVALD